MNDGHEHSQPALFAPDDAVRLADGDTALLAAAMAPEMRASVKAEAHEHIRQAGPAGLTVDEIHQRMSGVHLPTLSRRVTSLLRAGMVADSGRRRKTRRNAPAVVWVAVED
jgi:hypothetical protein